MNEKSSHKVLEIMNFENGMCPHFQSAAAKKSGTYYALLHSQLTVIIIAPSPLFHILQA
jgi:hypothetical protein